ncbi:MAG: hypothetical protein UT08_C0001G0039 [Candidatus Woesebacteria bacterium GW2011_GWB1_38_8]|uniref:Glycosyltransferase RgtA/B/C/D-like domain-containing protein n=1 Tax=Candidatus Woesebacteria bacterium GW2011_GWB1_38_8 TaxID=1618570 RepID=A0A0G0L2I4_9BACT|nr:MAG: hypothetical protein UT08_C0001G0039 [Candidatus Woesebacteria bacterium GW2011_GWB1_38_8]
MTYTKIYGSLKKDIILLLILAVFSVPYLFKFKIRVGFPPGYAGLYAQMAEEVVKNNFAYPDTISYYGGGSIPFAYPPLSFYLMALIVNVFQVNSMVYILFAPSIFLGMTYIAFYFTTKILLKSRLGAFLATLFFITSSGIMGYHYSAEGITRTLALLLIIGSLFFLTKYYYGNKRSLVYSALLWGSAALTHPTYAVYGAFNALVVLFYKKRKLNITYLSEISKFFIYGALLVIPWILIVVSKHSFTPFINVSGTHDTLNILNHISSFHNFYDYINAILLAKHETVILTSASLIGVLYLFLKKDFLMPSLFLVTFLTGGLEGQRFMAIISSVITAKFLIEIFSPILKSFFAKTRLVKAVTFTLLLMIVSLFVFNRMTEITMYKSSIDYASIQKLADYLNKNTSESTSYLLLSSNLIEHEWFPYFIKMFPVVNSFGREWTGDYNDEGKRFNWLLSCSDKFVADCKDIIRINNGEPNRLLILNIKQVDINLEREIKTNGWKKVNIQNEIYTIYEN